MATRAELKKLAHLRLREAETLFRAELYDGVAYLCGYCIEFALKARICRILGVREYPDRDKRLRQTYAVHDLPQLLLLAGLQSKIGLGNAELIRNWSVAANWKPERRYDPPGTYSSGQALEILEAVRSRRNGVLTWLVKRW
jgi:HEPN domain-containing protein